MPHQALHLDFCNDVTSSRSQDWQLCGALELIVADKGGKDSAERQMWPSGRGSLSPLVTIQRPKRLQHSVIISRFPRRVLLDRVKHQSSLASSFLHGSTSCLWEAYKPETNTLLLPLNTTSIHTASNSGFHSVNWGKRNVRVTHGQVNLPSLNVQHFPL